MRYRRVLHNLIRFGLRQSFSLPVCVVDGDVISTSSWCHLGNLIITFVVVMIEAKRDQ